MRAVVRVGRRSLQSQRFNPNRPAAATSLRSIPRASRAFCDAASKKTEEVLKVEADGLAAGSGSALPRSDGKDAKTVYALPLLTKPAFPGYRQTLHVKDAQVFDFLVSLRTSNQGKLGGFLTKKQDGDAPEGLLQSGWVAKSSELHEVGAMLSILEVTANEDSPGGTVVVLPMVRIRIDEVVLDAAATTDAEPTSPPLSAVTTVELPEPKDTGDDNRLKALQLQVTATGKALFAESASHRGEMERIVRTVSADNQLRLVNLMAGLVKADRAELQAVLAEQDTELRLRKILQLMNNDLEYLQMQASREKEVMKKLSGQQKKMMLMAQLKEIRSELGLDKDDKEATIAQFKEAVKDKTLPEEAQKAFDQEMGKLGGLEPSSSEFNVSRTYLEWLTALPWGHSKPEHNDIVKVEQILNDDHHGLEDVKDRIMEHVAVSFLKGSTQGKIICLVGPPGTGKTSVGKSVASALGREYFRFSVGGLHDVAEVRGHRRTYVGAMPGKLVQSLKITGCMNPVILIDEIDKLGRGAGGDPSSALLEVLDPEQNVSFRDLYLDVGLDLSKVLFICTANVLDTIPGPLLDRMEVIRLAGYVHDEKVAIAEKYIIPAAQKDTGVGADVLEFKQEAVEAMISGYAREAGVRTLRQLIEKVSRKVALKMVRGKGDGTKEEVPASFTVGSDNLADYLGQPIFDSQRMYPSGTPPGVITGLAWTSMGGTTLFVEARARLPKGNNPAAGTITGMMQTTGKLGKVMEESSSISLTYARMFARTLDAENSFLDTAHIHLHVPEGATPKDGPSAGITMAAALVSLAFDVPVKTDLGMTGELTLTGKVLKVGGIKEKVIGARREGLRVLILPRQNEADYMELKEYLRAGLTVHFVDHFDDVYRLAFDLEKVPRLDEMSPFRELPITHELLDVSPLQVPSDGTTNVPLSESFIIPQRDLPATKQL